jgi:hypothetical protein
MLDDTGRFYTAGGGALSSHLALRWKGRVRYVVPRQAAGQRACWEVFHPGLLGIPLRAMGQMPRVFKAKDCVEGPSIASIRKIVAERGGMSCCSAGAAGVWCKDTLLFLDERINEPKCIVKVGEDKDVGRLLTNEAEWLSLLGAERSLAEHIPGLLAHGRTGGMSFVAQRPLTGSMDTGLGSHQIAFLLKLQNCSLRHARYHDSKLRCTFDMRVRDLTGRLPEEWSTRIEKALLAIERSLGDSPIPLVAAHNDFTAWNVRIRKGRACVFDWEFADHEQMPLFDPLHYVLAPMALHSRPIQRIRRTMFATIDRCKAWFSPDRCYKPEIQALAYMLRLCTLYQWADGGTRNTHPTLVSFAPLIDELTAAVLS